MNKSTDTPRPSQGRGGLLMPARIKPLARPPQHDCAERLDHLLACIEASPRVGLAEERQSLLFDAIHGPHLHHQTAMCNPNAMIAIERLCRLIGRSRLKLKHLLAAHGDLVDNGGELRQHAAFVGGFKGRFSSYVPPQADAIPKLLEDLIEFVANRRFSPLLSATVSMVRLLQIHPFADGNGRTGRLLFMALLIPHYGWRPIYPRILNGIFDSGNHELLLASMHQQRTGDWSEVLMLLQTNTTTWKESAV